MAREESPVHRCNLCIPAAALFEPAARACEPYVAGGQAITVELGRVRAVAPARLDTRLVGVRVRVRVRVGVRVRRRRRGRRRLRARVSYP